MNAEDGRLMIKAVADGFKMYYKIGIGLTLTVAVMILAVEVKVQGLEVNETTCTTMSFAECEGLKERIMYTLIITQVISVAAALWMIREMRKKQSWDEPAEVRKKE